MSVVENNFGAYNIANNTVEYNPQRVNNFNLVVEDIDGVLRSGSVAGSTSQRDVLKNAQQEIMIGLKRCDVPTMSQSTIQIQKGNSTIKFPGRPTFDDINLEAYDLIGSNIKDTFLAWQNLCYNRRYDSIGNKSQYKKNCILYEYEPGIEGKVVRYWKIEGAWPSRVQVTGKDAGGDENSMISVTLSIDRAEMHLPDEIQ